MILSGVVLLSFVLPKMQLNAFSIFKNRTDRMYLIAFALLGLLLCQYTFMGAIKYSNSATATVLQSLNVVMIAVIVLVGTAGGFSAFLQGVKYIGPVKATLIGCIEPATAAALSAVCLGSTFGMIEMIGFLCILSTVFLSVSKE